MSTQVSPLIYTVGVLAVMLAVGVCVLMLARRFGVLRSMRITAPGVVLEALGDHTVDPLTALQAVSAVATEALEVAQRADARSERLESAIEVLRVRETQLVSELAHARVEAQHSRTEAEALRSRVVELEAELIEVRTRLTAAEG